MLLAHSKDLNVYFRFSLFCKLFIFFYNSIYNFTFPLQFVARRQGLLLRSVWYVVQMNLY